MRRLLGLLLAAVLLAGCADTSTTAVNATTTSRSTTTLAPTPTSTAVAIPTATSTPTPTATSTETSAPTVTTRAAPSPIASAGANLAYSGPACRADPHSGIYHPQRLVIEQPCVQVVGVVDLVRQEADGDAHINVRLATAGAALLNARNLSGEHGDLVVEIVPADQAGCTPGQPPKPPRGSYDYGRCSGANVRPPAPGQLVRVIGPYVLDADHGWMEVHPVWSLTVLQRSAALPPAPVSAKAAPTPRIPDNQQDAVPPTRAPSASAATSAPTAAAPPGVAGHSFYASSYGTAEVIYCDDDPGWKKLSPTYLQHFPSWDAAHAAYPTRTLHRPC